MEFVHAGGGGGTGGGRCCTAVSAFPHLSHLGFLCRPPPPPPPPQDQYLGSTIRYADFVSLLVRKAIVPVELKNVKCLPDDELCAPGICMSVLRV